MTAPSWRAALEGRMPEGWAREIDIFETEIHLRKQGKLEEKLFAETRLRRGTYGQRYDNGQRHDGKQTRTLAYPAGQLTKGPMTLWDAPGMSRIKVPYGRMTAAQIEALAECAEEYSDAILHVTTRQDIQLHFVHIEDTPDLMRRLAAVGFTTREACGNSIRNITACPYAGVCSDESFDVSAYADAMMYFLLGHPDVQDFGRKFKIALSGCKDHPCGLVTFHDLGAIAKTRTNADGTVERGFEVVVGGGLGAVPHLAKVLYDFLPEAEILPVCQAVSRVFGRLGEKQSRAKARIKFLVKKLGEVEFKRLVEEERKTLKPDPRWTEFLERVRPMDEATRPPGLMPAGPYPEGFEAWRASNVEPQRQKGYATVTVTLPLGDLTSDQARGLADLARTYGDTIRTTVDQNLLWRWISEADVVDLYRGLAALKLAEPGAGSITDVTSCPGTDTCKLGISSSRGLSGELRKRLRVLDAQLDDASRSLHVKASGCFNSCGQHHVADLGFFGVSRSIGGRKVPHFQLVVGGQWTQNAASYGLAIVAIPSKNVPDAVERITKHFQKERQPGETFQTFIKRTGKAKTRALVEDLTEVPPYDEDPTFYSDWRDPREYSIGDMGIGECAGEIVTLAEFALAASEREVFEAQVKLEEGEVARGARLAYSAMLTAAKGLVQHRGIEVSTDADEIVTKFKTYLYEPQIFQEHFVGARFAQFFFRAHEDQSFDRSTAEQAHHSIEEATLFIEAAHACYARMNEQRSVVQLGAAE